MPFPPDSYSLAEELKRINLQCYILLNPLKATLPSMNIECNGSKVREDYNGVPICFSGNELSSSVNSSETDLKKKSLLKQKSIQIIPPLAKNKRVGSNKEIENTSVDRLNYPKESINTYNTGDESEWKKEFSTDESDYDASGFDRLP